MEKAGEKRKHATILKISLRRE